MLPEAFVSKSHGFVSTSVWTLCVCRNIGSEVPGLQPICETDLNRPPISNPWNLAGCLTNLPLCVCCCSTFGHTCSVSAVSGCSVHLGTLGGAHVTLILSNLKTGWPQVEQFSSVLVSGWSCRSCWVSKLTDSSTERSFACWLYCSNCFSCSLTNLCFTLLQCFRH